MNYLIGFFFILCGHITCNAYELDYRQLVFDTLQNSDFNGAVLLSKNNELVVQEYVGFADKDRKIPLNRSHIFSPGSVAKEFTTISLMQLVAQGKLQYQDKLINYIETLPAELSEVTVEHILSHTSGLPKIQWHKGITTQEVIEQINNAKLNFSAGEGYLYSNLNVVLRALLVERLTSSAYTEFFQKHIVKVAGMSDSYEQTNPTHINPKQVVGDYLTFLTGVTIYVTPTDLIKFEQVLWSGKLVDVNDLKRVLHGDKLSGKKNPAYFDFGSFKLDETGDLVSWEHDGSNPSHHTLKYHDFANGYILVIMSNDGNKSTLFKIRDRLHQAIHSS